jgi:two-component system sensor histidine kinase VicK
MPMAQEQASDNRAGWRQPFRRFFSFNNIRSKIVMPYLVLTLIVAVIGIYVVMTLVASSLDERLTNQLLEAGRVVADGMARREMEHLESARAIAFTVGLAEALRDGDRDGVVARAQPAAVARNVECLVIVDAHGQEILHMLQQDDGSFAFVEGQFDAAGLWIVQTLLEAGDPGGLPRRGLVLHTVNERYYYLTAIPVGLEGEMIGVAVVGTSLDTLLAHLKVTSLADVIIYLDGGRAVATTFTGAEQSADTTALLDELSTTPALYENALHSTDSTIGENIRIRDRWYRLARGPLRVADDSLGAFAVVLPSNFIVEKGVTSRNTYAVIFLAAMAGVVAIGYLISQRITSPLSRLVHTSQIVAEGNLEQRTGIVGADEIGLLAATFDNMTGQLAERTYALEETLGRLRAILSSIGDGVVLEDLKGNLLPLNATAEAMLKELADHAMLDVLHELSTEEGDEIPDLRSSAWLLERRRFEVGQRMISTSAAAVRTESGEHLGTVIVLRDVTAEAEAERLKDAFITHVSHELRTPLTAITGYSELLIATAGNVLNETQRGFLETISRNTNDLLTMINALLDFSEVEAGGKLGLRQRPVQLCSIVEQVAEEWRPQMDSKDLAFQVETLADSPMVSGDAKRLHWAFTNLVRNAWQYTSDGGSVTLHLSEQDGHVKFDVIDTGRGISPEEKKQIFSRLYRVDEAMKGEERGLGLGLYVTRAIIEAHGGEISVVSEEGAGSTFSVILPVQQMKNG